MTYPRDVLYPSRCESSGRVHVNHVLFHKSRAGDRLPCLQVTPLDACIYALNLALSKNVFLFAWVELKFCTGRHSFCCFPPLLAVFKLFSLFFCLLGCL